MAYLYCWTRFRCRLGFRVKTQWLHCTLQIMFTLLRLRSPIATVSFLGRTFIPGSESLSGNVNKPKNVFADIISFSVIWIWTLYLSRPSEAQNGSFGIVLTLIHWQFCPIYSPTSFVVFQLRKPHRHYYKTWKNLFTLTCLHFVPLTAGKRKRQKNCSLWAMLVITDIFCVAVNYFDAKKYVRNSQEFLLPNSM